MPDDGGVLENLPRSRPGQRSEKRAAAGEAADEAAQRPAATSASGPKREGDTRRTAAPKGKPRGAARPTEAAAEAAERAERSDSAAAKPAPGAGPRRRQAEPPPARHRDPVGDVIRGAAKVAGAGVRVAGAVAHEVLRRLPRP